MSNWPGTNGPGQPPGDPYYYPPQAAPQPGGWPPTQPAGPGAMELAASGEPVLVSIGDISVTHSRVYTPSGSRPLNEVSWSIADMSVTSEAIPTWAIVCAIVFAVFCLLGLLFLLAKETRTNGSVQVTVHGPGFVHTTQIPVYSLAQVADVNARVNYVRTLTASYPAAPQPGQAQPGQAQPGQAQPGQGQWPGQQQGPA